MCIYKGLIRYPPQVTGRHTLHFMKMGSLDAHTLPSKRLSGRVAIITGGARGIGAATATLFAQHGAHVVIADILDDLGGSLADAIQGRYVHCDVSKESDVESAVKFALEWRGRLDIMFNNAGIGGPGGSIASLDMDHLKSLTSVNLHGTIHGVKHGARAMIKGGMGGSIICNASTAALMGGLAGHAYTLSKAAIIGLAKSCARELGLHKIRVNCISPHGVPSEMLLDGYRRFLGKNVNAEDVVKDVEDRSSIKGRGARAEDMAQAALFLASNDSAGFITGHNLVVDGGFTSVSNTLGFIYKELNSN